MVQFFTVIRLGLRAKLLMVILGLLSILTAGALLTVRHEFGQQLHQQAARELQASSHVLSSVLQRSGAQLLDRGRLLAELPSLRQALLKDPKQLESLLMEVKAIRAANLLWATDPNGKVLASTGEYPPLSSTLADRPLISAALSGQETLGFDLFSGDWWLILTLPVKKSDRGEVLGTVTLSLLVGEAYLARLSELLKCQVGFVWGTNQIWSDGWPEGAHNEIVPRALYALTKPPQEIASFHAGRTLWLARLMTGGTPPIAAGPMAILGTRLDESVIQRTTRTIGWIALFALAIGTFLSTWAIRSMTRPLKSLVLDSQRIGAGDLAHRSAVRGSDEVSELAGSFNQMVDRLQHSYNELAEFNRTLEQRVQERTRQLEEAQAKLLQAEKLASIGQLAAGVAHELNNPLMVIMGNTQLALRILARSPQLPRAVTGELTELLQALDQESHRSKTIVSNLLDFSRVKPPTRVDVDIHTLLDESVALVGHQASLQSVQVARQYAKGLPTVKADPGQIKQVFVNVILNAVQAMPSGGTLRIETGIAQKNLTIAIQDTGSGIPAQVLQRVFDPFFTTKAVGSGTGLGLSLSYGIIQSHQGAIEIKSEPSRGTTVIIQLPLTP